MAARAMLLLRRLGPAATGGQWAVKAPTLVGQSTSALPVVSICFFGPTRVIILDFGGFEFRRRASHCFVWGENGERGDSAELSGHVGTFGAFQTRHAISARQLNYSNQPNLANFNLYWLPFPENFHTKMLCTRFRGPRGCSYEKK